MLGGLARGQTGPELPAGFIAEPIGSAWEGPVALHWLDGARLLVGEKAGRVWYVEDKVKRNVVLDLTSEILSNGDRGLLGLAAHPEFDLNGWIYLLLVVDPNGDGGDEEQESFSRLVRYTTAYDPEGNLVADPGSRLELLGSTWSTGIPSLHLSHAGGRLAFLSDGSLVLSHGDGAHWDLIDPGGHDPGGFGPGKFGPEEDVGAFRSLEVGSLAGKVLRVDPATGLGLPDNPFYTGDPDDAASRVWALGLRNPYRFTLVPGTGPRETLFVCDVGHGTWEEIDLCRGGENFGWPCYEGWPAYGAYQSDDPDHHCDGLGGVVQDPWLNWNHHTPGSLGFTGSCASAACVYSGTSYPPIYRGALFFCDLGQDWMKTAPLDAELHFTAILHFGSAMGAAVDIESNPANGDLTYISLGFPNRVLRLRYTPSNLPPTAVAEATPTWGGDPLSVKLSAAGSSDPEGDALDYHWELGDGSSSNEAELTHVYQGHHTYTAVLTVTDDLGSEDTDQVVIAVSNTPPKIESIVAPLDGELYEEGVPIALECTAMDLEDDAAGTPLHVTWDFDLVHDHHTHPLWARVDGLAGSWTPEPHGDGSHLLHLTLTVEDSRGLRDVRGFTLYDSDATPLPHVTRVSDPSVRLGSLLGVHAHVDYATPPGSPLATLTFDWGDGTSDVFPDSAHQVERVATHAYAALGHYDLRVVASTEEQSNESLTAIEVRRPGPATAVFLPLVAERNVPWLEQQHLAEAIQAGLTLPREVAVFTWDEQSELVEWMKAYAKDELRDMLVLLDFAPVQVFAGEADGSLAEEWLESGNGILWTGGAPFAETIDVDGSTSVLGPDAVDKLLDSEPGLCAGAGPEMLRPVAARYLPSLQPTNATNALRLDRLGPSWPGHLTFARGADQDSDALALRHRNGGVYAQFYCLAVDEPQRERVLVEFLRRVLRGRVQQR